MTKEAVSAAGVIKGLKRELKVFKRERDKLEKELNNMKIGLKLARERDKLYDLIKKELELNARRLKCEKYIINIEDKLMKTRRISAILEEVWG